MSSNEVPRPSKSDKEWRGREQPQRLSPSASSSQPTDSPAQSGSLRSRISDKEPSRAMPQAPASHRKDGTLSDGHGDISRKRASSGMWLHKTGEYMTYHPQSVIPAILLLLRAIKEQRPRSVPRLTVTAGEGALVVLLVLRYDNILKETHVEEVVVGKIEGSNHYLYHTLVFNYFTVYRGMTAWLHRRGCVTIVCQKQTEVMNAAIAMASYNLSLREYP